MPRTWALLSSTIFLAFVAGCSSDIDAPGGQTANSGGTTGSGTGGSVANGGSSGTSGKSAGGASGSAGSAGTSGSSGSSGMSGSSGTAGSTSGASGSAGSSGSSSVPDTCPTTRIEATTVRRLTRFEYANTVRDLLGITDVSAANDLPADEVSNGFDNEASVLTVSSLHAEKYVLISEELAKSAVAGLVSAAACADTEDACALAFAKAFGRRAFRRPTTAADEQALIAAYTAGRTDGSYNEGIEVMVRAALQSPDFIYRLEITTPTATDALVPLSQFELATRLSYMIWATTPTDALLDAAQGGQLGSKEQVAAKAREMLADPKAKIGLANFFNQWSGVNRIAILTKNSDIFPNFDESMRTAMQKELPAFMEHVLFEGDHTLHSFLTEPTAFVSGPLGSLYGLTNAPQGDTPTAVDLLPEQGRSGLLTQAGFLAVQGHPDQTSPVLRGKFVRAMMLCDPPQPPPDNVNTNLPEMATGPTARDRFSAHDANPSCQGCHAHMDPIGFAFENFDAMGQYRTTDNGAAIDATGEIYDPKDAGLAGQFNGVRELGEKLAASSQVTDCIATQLYRYSAGRLEAAPDGCSLSGVTDTFSSSGGDFIELVVSLTQADNFWYRAPVTP